jgi:hypothetical protein
VLDLMAAGLRNQAIASRLYLSEKTVRNYVTNILVKLGVPDRTGAIVKSREAGRGGAPDCAGRDRVTERPCTWLGSCRASR